MATAKSDELPEILYAGGKCGKQIRSGFVPRTVQPSLLAQKSDLVVGVTSDEAHHNGFLLAPLKPVDGPQFNARIRFFKGLRHEGQLL